MANTKLTSLLAPVSERVLSMRSHDPNDHWLAEEIATDVKNFEKATHVMIGCPQDEGVRRNNGRTGAKEAPRKIRQQLYNLQVPAGNATVLYDAGDIQTSEPDGSETRLKIIHDRLTEVVSFFLERGKKIIVLGGGNDISYANIRALSKVEEQISAINIDAHLDMRIAEEMTSGTPYRKLIDDGFLVANHFYEFGIRTESNGSFYLKDAEKLGVHIHRFQQLLENGVVQSFQRILDEIDHRPFFLGLDMDSIQAADAPGVSASSPIGFSGREVMQLIRLARQQENLRVFEITEANPGFDIDNQTVKLAAQFIYSFLFG